MAGQNDNAFLRAVAVLEEQRRQLHVDLTQEPSLGTFISGLDFYRFGYIGNRELINGHVKIEPPERNPEFVTELPENNNVEMDIQSVDELLGNTLTERIRKLRSIPAAIKPPGITSTPHQHQLFALSRLAFLCKSPLRGGILADPMGMGKTLVAIMLMLLLPKKAGEGPWIIVTRKSIIENWQEEIENNLAGKYRMKVLVPDAKTSATELYKHDIILTNYEYIAHQYTAKMRHKSFIDDQEAEILPSRPLLSILSEIHILNKVEFKVILDESQFIKNTDTAAHKGCYEIPRSATIMLSGSLLDNEWSDIRGLLRMLAGHTFGEIISFFNAFGSRTLDGKKTNPTPLKIRRLIKFLLSCVIMRPSWVLHLPNLELKDVEFDLNKEEQKKSDCWMEKYLAAMRYRPNGQSYSFGLHFIIRALQEAIHQDLSSVRDTSIDIVPGLLWGLAHNDNAAELPVGDKQERILRSDWLNHLSNNSCAENSSRMRKFKELFSTIRRVYPRERVAITSERTAVLDIISIIVENMGVTCVNFDGRVAQKDRKAALQTFQQSTPGTHVLLITPGTGGTGINIIEASVVIQIESWWNHNVEKQLYG